MELSYLATRKNANSKFATLVSYQQMVTLILGMLMTLPVVSVIAKQPYPVMAPLTVEGNVSIANEVVNQGQQMVRLPLSFANRLT